MREFTKHSVFLTNAWHCRYGDLSGLTGPKPGFLNSVRSLELVSLRYTYVNIERKFSNVVLRPSFA